MCAINKASIARELLLLSTRSTVSEIYID